MDIKECSICKELKSIKDFGKYKKSKDGLNNKCKTCKREYDREYHKNRDDNSISTKYIKQANRIERNSKFVFDYLKEHPCEECGEDNPICLDFNHLKRELKSFGISDGVRGGFSIELLKIEIGKCNVLCANCHRKHTAKQLGWYKHILQNGSSNLSR